MAAPAPLTALCRRPAALAVAASFALYALISLMILGGVDGLAALRFRIDLSPLLTASTVLQLHIAAALASFSIGCILLAGGKGGARHRALGYAWIVTMTLTAASSLFLTEINPGRFSLIHGLSAWTLVMLPMGLAAARRHNIKAHRRYMTGLFLGGMVIAGLFTFLPGRMMWSLFFAA
jgi:uncharacterized membrane protein